MMRTALVCLLAALAVSAAANVPTPFKGQQSYVYRFDSQVSSSLVGTSASEIQQQAATRVRADVHISFANERHAKLQLQHVRLGELNAELPKSQRVQPLEHFERRDIPQQLKRQLEMPLSISYVDGVVERINFHEEDDTFSKNIKRAVLNVLQLNLKRNDVQGLKQVSSVPQEEKDQEMRVFQLPEITLEGLCETNYAIQQDASSQQQQDERATFNVTKTINFAKCEQTADVTYGYFANPSQQLKCLKCIKQQKSLSGEAMEKARYTHCATECQANAINDAKDIERSTFVRFELQGKPERYAIKRASLLSSYIVKAQNPSSQNAITQVISLAELTFREQVDNDKLVPAFKQSSQDSMMLYDAEWDIKEKRFYMAGDAEFERASPFAAVPKKEQKVAHAMRSILTQWATKKQQGYELDSALQFNRLVQLVRESSVAELRKIEDIVRSAESSIEGCNKQCEQHARALFIDALAVAATRNSLHVLAAKMMKSEIEPTQAVQALQLFMANQHSPSEQQTDILERLAKHEIAHRSAPLKQAVWLTFGASIGAICQDKPSQGQRELFRVEELCPRGKKQQWKNTLTQMWRDAQGPYEQILALKAISNAALDNTLEELQAIVVEKRQPVLIRMEAIDAMRRLRTSQATKIVATLLPIFQNEREQPEVRMAAFSLIMYTHPEKAILDQLVGSVMNTRSQNVKSFVITALESLSQSPSSAEQEAATHLKAALKAIAVDEEQMRASRKYRVPIYVSENENTEEQNIFFGLASIVSPTNAIPVHLSASLRSALNGEATEENMQLSFTQKNVEQWLRQLTNLYTNEFEDEQSSYNNKEGGDNQQEERRSAKDLRSIYSSLGIKSRRTGSYFLSDEQSQEDDEQQQQQQGERKMGSNKPFAMVVLRTGDVDVAVLPLGEDQMPRVVRKVLIEQQKPTMADFEELSRALTAGRTEKHVAATLGEKKTKIPTTAGLPLALIRQTTIVASFEAHMQSQMESADLSASRSLNAHLKLHMSAVATHTHETQVWTPILSTGVKSLRTVEWNTPIELKVRADAQKLEIKVLPPRFNEQQQQQEQQERIRFFGVHTLPMTYTRQTDMETQTKREARVKSVHNWALEHAQRELRAADNSEAAIVADGHYHALRTPAQMLTALYTTENNVHFYVQTERAPRELLLRISGAAFQRHDQHSRPELDTFYRDSAFGANNYGDDTNDDNDEQSQSQQQQQQRYTNEARDEEERSQKALSAFGASYGAKGAYKHQLKVEAEAKYPSGVARIAADIKGACDARVKHCKVFMDAERTPIAAFNERAPWKMAVKVQTVLPEIIRDEEEMSADKQNKMLVKLDANWGAEYSKDEMSVRIQAEPSREMRSIMQQQQGSQQQGSQQQKGSQQQGAQQQSVISMTRFLNKLDAIVNYKLKPTSGKYVRTVYEMLKARAFWTIRTEARRGEEGVVRARIVVDPITRRHANISVQTPDERVRAEGVEMPAALAAATYFRLERRPAAYRSMSGVMRQFSGFSKAECRVDSRRVRTFDGVAYKAPLSHCYSLVAASNGQNEQSRFAVLVKADGEQQRVKIVTQQTLVELSRKSDNERIEVRVDGKHERDQERLSELGIELTNGKVYFAKRGIEVEFDGEEAKIKVSNEYKNNMSGLCGHYDDEEDNEFMSADNKRSSNLKEFHRSFTLKQQECDESRLNKFYASQKSNEDFDLSGERQREQSRRRYTSGNRRSQWFDNDEESDEQQQQQQQRRQGEEQWMRSGEQADMQNIKPVERTEVIEYAHKICFSTEPLRRCPRGTTPDDDAKTQPKKAQFFCLERTSADAKQLMRQARRGIEIDNQGRQPSFVETIEQPTKCVAY